MFLVSKAAWAGIIFILLTTAISGSRPTPVASGPNLSKELPAVEHWNDVKNKQQTLQDKGHYSGKVDGVLGLRTRARIYLPQASLSPRPRTNSESRQKVTARVAPPVLRLSLQQAQNGPKDRGEQEKHSGRLSPELHRKSTGQTATTLIKLKSTDLHSRLSSSHCGCSTLLLHY